MLLVILKPLCNDILYVLIDFLILCHIVFHNQKYCLLKVLMSLQVKFCIKNSWARKEDIQTYSDTITIKIVTLRKEILLNNMGKKSVAFTMLDCLLSVMQLIVKITFLCFNFECRWFVNLTNLMFVYFVRLWI